jgi:hypothetical protein
MTHYNQNYWQERDDHQPGFIYVIEAVGVHGIIPGCVLRRVKIGLSRNPEARLETFHSNQPPVDMKIMRTIYVEDMAAVEQQLHQVFKNSNVKLKKSREFFDLYPWQIAYLHWLMSQHEVKVWSYADIPKRAIAGGLVALLGVGLLIGYSMRLSTSQSIPVNALEEIK